MTTNTGHGCQPISACPPTLWRRLRSAVRSGRARLRLQSLSDHVLRDIGLDRPHPAKLGHMHRAHHI